MGADHGAYIKTTNSGLHFNLNLTLIIVLPMAVREAKGGINALRLNGLFGNRVGWGNELGNPGCTKVNGYFSKEGAVSRARNARGN